MHRAVALLSLLALVLPARAFGFHQRTPAFLQITPVSAGTVGNPKWAGFRYVVFDSDADLLGNGSTGRQVFIFDLQERDITGGLAIQQLTMGGGNPMRATTGRRAKRVVYDAQLGGIGPRQLFMIDRKSGSTSQLTQGVSDSLNATIDDGDRVVVFESSADFFGSGLTGPQIYRIDLRRAALGCPYPCLANANAGLTRLTHTSGNNVNAVTSVSGKLTAFESDADPLGQGQTESQIYLLDNRSLQLTALSHGPGASHRPSLSQNGSLIAFESSADLLGNGSTGSQIFLHQRKKAILEQITHAIAGTCTHASVSSSRQALTFISSNDLLGHGSTGPEMYDYDQRSKTLQQLTNTPGSASEPSYSAGVFTSFLGDGDLLGNGSVGTQLYLINLYALTGQVP